MTSLGLQYGELKLKQRQLDETKRYNLAQESLKRSEIAEVIANNLRNYKINISKNDIQRLANDQLNTREIQKLGETFRSNLAKEQEILRNNLANEKIDKTKQSEVERHNLAMEKQAKLDQVSKELGKPGKYSINSIVAALFGLMPELELKQLYGEGTSAIKSNPKLGTPSSVSKLPNWSDNLEVMKWAKEAANYENYLEEEAANKGLDERRQKEKQVADIHHDDPNKPMYIGKNASRRGGTIYAHAGTEHDRRRKYHNEIPSDYSNSPGPSVYHQDSRNFINNLSVPSGTGSDKKGLNTSGGTNYSLSGGLKSSGVIYAGRS